MNSISARLLLANVLVLASFVALTALSVQHSVHSRAEQAQRDRMEGLIYGILGAAELDQQGTLQINEYGLPDGRLRQPESGLSARLYDADGRQVWRSGSDDNHQLLENTQQVLTGQWRFRQQESATGTPAFSLRFGFSWSNAEQAEKEFNILLLASADEHLAQLKVFDQKLLTTLLTSALLLLLLQLFVLMWGLKPLGKISRGLQRIQQGKDEQLDTRLPQELKPVAHSLNTLLHSERNRRTRYKNVIDDLAHSLKTPLSVMQNLAQDASIDSANRQTIAEQSGRMKDIIAYHIRRASVSGARPLGPAVAVKPLLQRLESSLQKVYRQRPVRLDIALEDDCKLRMDGTDLMEIFGNLLENAYKYGASRICVSRHISTEKPAHDFLVLTIDDNGPGFPDDITDDLLERGKRADTRVEGQGLGLAVSSELMAAYGGKLQLGRSEKLGGARITLYFSATI
ncbi:MAG: ATP-binding protein [Gammaproteobacteria bacterium]|nr:ATP-binding protein [Gammaproteobacteria bacterium]